MPGMGMVQVTLEDGSVVSVPYPWVPPAPRIKREQREKLARDWLVSLSQAPTKERIEQLIPLVARFPPRSPLSKIASAFVASNRLPVPEEVIDTYLHRQAAYRLRVSVDQVPESTRRHAAELIDQYRAEHDRGPTWSWLGRQIGLDRQHVAMLLHEMKRTGAVTFTRDPGSLRRVLPRQKPTRPPRSHQ